MTAMIPTMLPTIIIAGLVEDEIITPPTNCLHPGALGR
jgi:hypothetical protein